MLDLSLVQLPNLSLPHFPQVAKGNNNAVSFTEFCEDQRAHVHGGLGRVKGSNFMYRACARRAAHSLGSAWEMPSIIIILPEGPIEVSNYAHHHGEFGFWLLYSRANIHQIPSPTPSAPSPASGAYSFNVLVSIFWFASSSFHWCICPWQPCSPSLNDFKMTVFYLPETRNPLKPTLCDCV